MKELTQAEVDVLPTGTRIDILRPDGRLRREYFTHNYNGKVYALRIENNTLVGDAGPIIDVGPKTKVWLLP